MPNARIHNRQPNVRVSNFQTGFLSSGVTGSTTVTAGTPIGLLLALTYATDQTTTTTEDTYRGDYRPSVRISSI